MKVVRTSPRPIAVRQVELCSPLRPIDDVADYAATRIYVTLNSTLLGYVEIANKQRTIEPSRLRQAIVAELGLRLLDHDRLLTEQTAWSETMDALIKRYGRLSDAQGDDPDHSGIYQSFDPQYLLQPHHHPAKGALWASAITRLARRYLPAEQQRPALSPTASVSIVIATYDRPDDLRACLDSLLLQQSPRRIEIIVVDNYPASGLTAPVVAAFPGVVLVQEQRKGLSYARNAGISASSGDIVIATDDDVIAPPNWVEQLVAPFVRDDVMVVTGNVLPFELEVPSQHYFEAYGGLGRGMHSFEANADWFERFKISAVPTWQIGATANAAFRAQIFSDPQIGLLEESLGAGMPAGCSEDTYLFYKVLKAGYSIVYQPRAYVWHKHRRTMASLRKQIYSYSKGGIAYHLTTVFSDGDLRGLIRIFFELPKIYAWQLKCWLLGRRAYPISLLGLEIQGHLTGFWAFWASRRRVRQEGRSQPYSPAHERLLDTRERRMNTIGETQELVLQHHEGN